MSTGKTVPLTHRSLASHSIFSPPDHDSSSSGDVGPSRSNASPNIAPKVRRMVIRDKDLLVAFGRELRMTHIGDKDLRFENERVGTYAIVDSPHLTFDIQQLWLNPTGRLLAVVGQHRIVVIALPTLHSAEPGKRMSCRSVAIDEQSFGLCPSANITKAQWHPWGQDGKSLWILTSDGKLSEYNISQPDDPTQTFSFLSTTSASSSSRYSAVDPLSRYATSFAFSLPNSVHGSTMVHVLAANGDAYAMGPILPFKAVVPSESLERLRAQLHNSSQTVRRYGLYWVEDLLRQAKSSSSARGTGAESFPESPRGFGDRANESADTALPMGYVRVHPPHLSPSGGPASGSHESLRLQGPIDLTMPSNDEDEDDISANDLMWIDAAIEGGSCDPQLIVTWSNGVVLVGYEAVPVTPRWSSSAQYDPDGPPSFRICGAVRLCHAPKEIESSPYILPDALNDTGICVQSSRSVDYFQIDLESIKSGDASNVISNPSCLVQSSGTSAEQIVASSILTDANLGTTLLAMTASGKAVAIDMDQNIAIQQDEIPAHHSTESESIDLVDASLLQETFEFDRLRQSIPSTHEGLASTAKSIFPNKAEQTASASQLQRAGAMMAKLQEQTRALQVASQALEERFDLCVKESLRQLQQLKNCRDDVEKLKDSKASPRVVKMLDTQSDLSTRLEKVLRSLADEQRATSLEGDRQWAEGLISIKARLGTAEDGLEDRFDKLRDEFRRVKAELDVTSSPPKDSEDAEKLDIDIKQTSEEIRRLMRKMEGLSLRVQTTSA
ncbi:hypothetical protein BD324DRAFT_578902 [Kockovaella imperatae]|uniref:Uncharacterized protein n=1 Tax=Kockovaella imperatae TaxID=4999 RepID=A0A1Y1UKA1_9TREE|nr:hypothetical protein BD324DRAFT_578902 [Kockovaella imperatae]ORX37896.1 hypothetical protein BD324DRAFT_578902 [Kockovaella imperatae]